jgi:hypothetical protein
MTAEPRSGWRSVRSAIPPTTPPIGRRTARSSFTRSSRRARIQAVNTIPAIFANSEGWTFTGPRGIQRWAPCDGAIPKTARSASPEIATIARTVRVSSKNR